MRSALGQDVDPQVFEFEPPVAQVEFEIGGEGHDMNIERLFEIGEDRKAPWQVR